MCGLWWCRRLIAASCSGECGPRGAGAGGRAGPGRAAGRRRAAGKRIAAIVGCAEPTVVTWRRRYAERGLAGLVDEPRPGKPSPLPEVLPDRVLELTVTVPPTEHGVTHWSSRLLTARLAAEGSRISHA